MDISITEPTIGDFCQSEISQKEFLTFIWLYQSGLFELAPRNAAQRRRFEQEEAFDSLQGKCYFAPHARVKDGGKKTDVAQEGNVLWVDIDSLDALDWICERLAALGLEPSAVVFSGRKGYWVYLKLSNMIPVDEIERLNQGLAAVLGGDRCWNRDRLARLPGSIHPASGQMARVVSFTEVTFSYDQVAVLGEYVPAATEPDQDSSTALDEAGRSGSVTAFPTNIPLSRHHWAYIDAHPRKGQGHDRSKVEQSIFATLIAAGWTDDQILTFADHLRLSKHIQERMKRKSYEWTVLSLEKARSTSTSSTSRMCMQPCKRRRFTDRHEVLAFVKDQSRPEFTEEIRSTMGCSQRTAYLIIESFCVGGYIRASAQKRSPTYQLTEEGRKVVESPLRLSLCLPTLESLRTDSLKCKLW